jgi:hypothetical protein
MEQINVLVDAATGGAGFASCDSTLDEYDCIADLQFQAVENGEYYSDPNLPSGTASLSDVGGPLTRQPFGSVTTVSVYNTAFVVTAAPSGLQSGGDDGNNENEDEGNGGGGTDKSEPSGTPDAASVPRASLIALLLASAITIAAAVL